MEVKEISLYDLKKIENYFAKGREVIAYGNAKFYTKVKSFLSNEGLDFSAVAVTKNNKTQLINDKYTNVASAFKDSIVFICSGFHDEIIERIKAEKLKPKKIIVLNLSENTASAKKYKKILAKRMQINQLELVASLKGKEKVKIVFLAIHESVWKVEPVFKKMLADPYFEPEILVCPYTSFGEKRMLEDMEQTFNYFKDKGYQVTKSLKEDGSWVKLEDMQPDIVFFTNPHFITKKEYYDDAYLNYLSCYVPYFTDIASNYNLENVYNQVFHNMVWRIFVESEYANQRAKDSSLNNGVNTFVVCSPSLESLFEKPDYKSTTWKKQSASKLKIIYAPHQSISKNENPNLSTFLEVGEEIKRLAVKYKDNLQWSFKPHTLLKSKLYKHPDWGVEKTNQYYNFWQNSDFTQLDLGDYIQLFHESDAIIHDCGSFVLEYLLMKKPCSYLIFNKDNQLKAINDFGLKALESYHILTTHAGIEIFLKNIINGKAYVKEQHAEFLKEYVEPFYSNSSPSQKIINHIKKELQ